MLRLSRVFVDGNLSTLLGKSIGCLALSAVMCTDLGAVGSLSPQSRVASS